MWTRRQFLQFGGAAAALGTLPGGLRAETRASQGPHSVVVLMLRGGVDGVYAFDPKEHREVDAKVDVPYRPSQITQADGLLLGPHWTSLKGHAASLAVVRGLQVKTANHESGAQQMLRMKTGVSTRLPGILDIIGRRRDDRPLAAATLGRVSSLEYSPASFGGSTNDSTATLFDWLDAVEPDEFGLLSEVYAEHLEAVGGWKAGPTLDQTRDHLEQARALFARMPDVPRFAPDDWAVGGSAGSIARDLQRTLWLLENNLTRCVYVKVYLNWDSHYDNARNQRTSSRRFVSLLDRFLTELSTRTGPRGVLADSTLVVAGSELGRFPILNGVEGKDHFPETTLMFTGAGINPTGRGIAYGETGAMMEGLPVSLQTGRPDDAGSLLALDDIGTTLLHMTGYAPERYGYRGQRLSFLEHA